MTTRVFSAKRLAPLLLALLFTLALPACSKAEANDYQTQFDLGIHYLSDGNYEEAILAFTAAIEIDPKNAEAYLSLADVYLAMGDTDAAVDLLTEALAAVDDTSAVQAKLDLLTLRSEPEPEQEPLEQLLVAVNSQAELDALPLREDVKKITHLYGNDAGITDLSPLASLTALTEIVIGNPGADAAKGEIVDLSVLSQLPNLTYLSFYNNKISDLSPLKGLTKLRHLDLCFNEVSDLSPLSSLTGLTELELYGNSISDLSALRGLVNLTELFLDSDIHDISALSEMTGMKDLALSGANIDDLSVLYSLTELEDLTFWDSTLTQEQLDALRTHLPNCDVNSF